jgi:hypothetical protein
MSTTRNPKLAIYTHGGCRYFSGRKETKLSFLLEGVKNEEREREREREREKTFYELL